MSADRPNTRISPGALLVIGAFVLVFVIEGRVAFGFLGLDVPFWVSGVIGVVAYGLIVFWGTLPPKADHESEASNP